MGAGFWVRYLSEHPELFVDKVLLVAPWVNSDRSYNINFFDFEVDPAVTGHANEFTIFASDNDADSVKDSVKVLAEKLPNITIRDFHGYGHFTMGSMKTDAFPELLAAIL